MGFRSTVKFNMVLYSKSFNEGVIDNPLRHKIS